MRSRGNGFTITELLIVVAILVLLAGLLFPVFAEAKSAAQRVGCSSNFRQAYGAASLYLNDYDDTFMPVNQQPGMIMNSHTDRTWVQLILPYASNFSIFQCPSDSTPRPKPTSLFDQDLVIGERYSEYYTASLRSNIGYNYMYLAPIVKDDETWNAMPRSATDVVEPSRTLLFIDSLWSRTKDGVPYGGGNWLVVPPCRYGANGDSFGGSGVDQYFSLSKGWTLGENSASYVYGGAWPWHTGKIMTVRLDGSVKVQSVAQLSEGCDLQGYWKGTITDQYAYPWDLR